MLAGGRIHALPTTSIAIHWFRRDLRLADNVALHEAHRQAALVVPLFVLDPRLLSAGDMGAPRLSFLLDCLRRLDESLRARGSRLVLRQGAPEREVPAVARAAGADTVFWNRDYSPYAIARDTRVRHRLEAAGIQARDWKDHLLVEPCECVKDDGSPYTVFTPFARRWRTHAKSAPVGEPRIRPLPPPLVDRCRPREIPGSSAELGHPLAIAIEPAGEEQAQRRLDEFVRDGLLRYRGQRDFPAIEGTSRLSPHLKFGTVSPRTIHDACAAAIGRDLADLEPSRPGRPLLAAEQERLREGGAFLDEICWREFYQSILFHFPHVATRPFRASFTDFRWPGRDPRLLAAWRDGQTGFPLVDAAMRQLASTGWMHNRLRMVAAMFLTKTLLVDWREGERVFMQRLTDGDLASNNGGWQWSASTGTDAAPYFRIFNPLAQASKFDPTGDFVRRFVPELARLPVPLVHDPWREPLTAAASGYPRPIVDHAESRARALALLGPIARGTPG